MPRKTAGAERATAGRPKRVKAEKPERAKAEPSPRKKRFAELTELKREAPLKRWACCPMPEGTTHMPNCPERTSPYQHPGGPDATVEVLGRAPVVAPKVETLGESPAVRPAPAQLALPLQTDDEEPMAVAVIQPQAGPLATVPVYQPTVMPAALVAEQQLVNIQVNASGLLAASGGRPFNLVIG